MKYLPVFAVTILALGTSTAQTPDSTVMSLSVEGGASVPVTTIIPVAQPPIQEVDTTYIRTTPPPDSDKAHLKKGCIHPCKRDKKSRAYRQNRTKKE
jgi:hypothetical protein